MFKTRLSLMMPMGSCITLKIKFKSDQISLLKIVGPHPSAEDPAPFHNRADTIINRWKQNNTLPWNETEHQNLWGRARFSDVLRCSCGSAIWRVWGSTTTLRAPWCRAWWLEGCSSWYRSITSPPAYKIASACPGQGLGSREMQPAAHPALQR